MHWPKTLALVIFFERVFWVILHQVHSHLFTMFKTLSKVWHPLLVDVTALSCMKAYLKTTNKFRRPILEFDFFFHQRGKFSLRHPKKTFEEFWGRNNRFLGVWVIYETPTLGRNTRKRRKSFSSFGSGVTYYKAML